MQDKRCSSHDGDESSSPDWALSVLGRTAPKSGLVCSKAAAAWLQSRRSISRTIPCASPPSQRLRPPPLFIEKEPAKWAAVHFAIAAAQAMDHSAAKVDDSSHDHVGVHIGSGIGGFDIIEREHPALIADGPRRISPFFIPAAHREPCGRPCLDPLRRTWAQRGHSNRVYLLGAFHRRRLLRIIERGDADAMIAGGTEAAITPMGVGGFAAMKAGSPHATTTPPTPAVPGTRTVTASSSAKGPASSFSKNSSLPARAALRSSPRSSAMACPQTLTT